MMRTVDIYVTIKRIETAMALYVSFLRIQIKKQKLSQFSDKETKIKSTFRRE